MTPRQKLLTVLRREGMPEVPFDIALTPHQYDVFKRETGETDVEAWFRLWHRHVSSGIEASADTSTLYDEDLPDGTTFDPWGVAHAPGSEAALHMTRLHHPLAGDVTVGSIANYPMPSVSGEEQIAEEVAQLHREGIAAVGNMAQTIWETAWAIRSMEDLMVDMLSNDERGTALLDRVTDVSVRRAAMLTATGCDIIQLGDDIGMQRTPMMSVDLWRTYLKPRLAQVIDAVRAESAGAIIFYHSCGFVAPFIDDLIEIGIQVLNPIQPESMSFADIHSRYHDRLSFWGTIGTQTTMPFGGPEDVRFEVHRNVSLCREEGGLVIGPTHIVEPEVPWENIVALREACDSALALSKYTHRK